MVVYHNINIATIQRYIIQIHIIKKFIPIKDHFIWNLVVNFHQF